MRCFRALEEMLLNLWIVDARIIKILTSQQKENSNFAKESVKLIKNENK